MYIAPSTNITILKNVPLDSEHINTLYFESVESQTSYFNSMAKYALTNQSFQRVNKNVCRVQIPAEQLNDCNYLMFRNTGFTNNKRYYAFIDTVDYVNNETSDITYHIDVIQTYYFDYEIYGFVEREHSLSDKIGINILPENVNCGEYVYNDYKEILNMKEMCCIIAIVDTSSSVDGTLYGGVYGSANLWVYASTDVQGINSKISEYIQSPDSVLAVYMCPLALIGETIPSTHKLPYGATGFVHNISFDAVTTTDKLDGYTPRNNKMYTYPYTYFCVDNASGASLSLRYEFFDNRKPVVEIGGTITQPVIATLRPCSYKGVNKYDSLGGYTTLNTETLQLNNFPQCSWNNDSYQAWVAQNSVSLMTSGLSSVIGTTINGALTGGYIGATLGGFAGVASLVSESYQASIQADQSRGNFNNGGANVAMGKQNFYGGRVSVSEDYARMIDDYFSRYGYATNSLKRPNTHARQNFTYTKTRDAQAIGEAPASALDEISKIYNSGITFWVDPEKVGQYNIANDTLSD